MKINSEKKYPAGSLGTTVRVPRTGVEKGRRNLNIILAVVMRVWEDGFWRLGHSEVILKELYAIS